MCEYNTKYIWVYVYKHWNVYFFLLHIHTYTYKQVYKIYREKKQTTVSCNFIHLVWHFIFIVCLYEYKKNNYPAIYIHTFIYYDLNWIYLYLKLNLSSIYLLFYIFFFAAATFLLKIFSKKNVCNTINFW